jgi:hypothetical protein
MRATASAWANRKQAEKDNKGAAAVRGDYLAGSYHRSKFADFQMPIKQGGRLWRRRQREIEAAFKEEGAIIAYVAIERLEATRHELKAKREAYARKLRESK